MSSSDTPRSKADAAKKALRGTWKATKATVNTVGKVSRGTRSATRWTMEHALGATKYRRNVDDLAGRLSDALQRLEAALRERDEEIRRLRAEVERLGGAPR